MIAKVTIDGEHAYEALLIKDARTDELVRWNGFVIPWFDRANAEALVADIARDNRPDMIESDRFVWEGDTLLQFRWDGEPTRNPEDEEIAYVRKRIQPSTLFDGIPRYCIGGFEWTWSLAEPDWCPRCSAIIGLVKDRHEKPFHLDRRAGCLACDVVVAAVQPELVAHG